MKPSLPAQISARLEALFAAPHDSGLVRCTHCGSASWCRGYEEGEVVQLCPACELILDHQHSCKRCGDRALTDACAQSRQERKEAPELVEGGGCEVMPSYHHDHLDARACEQIALALDETPRARSIFPPAPVRPPWLREDCRRRYALSGPFTAVPRHERVWLTGLVLLAAVVVVRVLVGLL